MEKCYKFRIYPNAEQKEIIAKIFGCCRFVFNQFLAERIEAYKTENKTISRFEQDKNLTELKKDLVWLKEADSTALQTVVQNLDQAYQNFFRRVKSGDKPGFPKFKSKRNNRKSYKSKTVGKNIEVFAKSIKLPKLGVVDCRVSKQIEGRIISATVSQNPSGKYFVSVCCSDVEIEPFAKTGAVTGIDVGLKEFAITSDDEKFANHKYLYKSEKKLKREQRRLSRKPKGSQNRSKSRLKVALVHEKVSNQRVDFLHKLSTDLVRNYDVICVESLKIKNMVKNRKLAKSISDVSWGEFLRQLEYKCGWYGKYLVKIPQFYASSQRCHICGYKNEAVKDLKVRSWVCPECNASHDRDANAAKNILNKGMEMFAAV
jgi:putative transposase